MITYVNSVLVSNKNGNSLVTSQEMEGVNSKDAVKALVGKFAFMNCDPADDDPRDGMDIYAPNQYVDVFKIGVVTDGFITKNTANGVKYVPIVKWSNEIKSADIKSVTVLDYKPDTEDKITIDFSTID